MKKRIGRRRGSPDTRESILDAARRLFAEKGFDTTTVRAIATEADVDPAMIHHYFGTKEDLFRETLQFPINPADLIPYLIAGGREELGERLVATFVRIWDSPVGVAGVALIRSAVNNERMARLLREFVLTQLMRRVAKEVGMTPEDAQLRVSLVGSQLAGLVMMRYIIKVEPIASMPADELVPIIAPNVHRYITGDLP